MSDMEKRIAEAKSNADALADDVGIHEREEKLIPLRTKGCHWHIKHELGFVRSCALCWRRECAEWYKMAKMLDREGVL